MQNFNLSGFNENFEGVNCGRWNGWACPIFTFEEAQRFTDYINAEDCGLVGNYDAEKNAFCFEDLNADFLEFFEETDNNGVKGYAIGAFSWCWTIEEESK